MDQAVQTIMTPVRFDYTAIDETAASQLKEAAGRVRAISRRIFTDIIEAGRRLSAVKHYLKHGQFNKWLQAECGINDRTARYYMVAANFYDSLPAEKSATVADLPPATVYLLASPSTPESVRTEVLEAASKGNIVTTEAARARVAEVKTEEHKAQVPALASAARKKKRAGEPLTRREASALADKRAEERRTKEAKERELIERQAKESAAALFTKLMEAGGMDLLDQVMACMDDFTQRRHFHSAVEVERSKRRSADSRAASQSAVGEGEEPESSGGYNQIAA